MAAHKNPLLYTNGSHDRNEQGQHMHETITPKDDAHWKQLRTQDLTSTDIAALFGLSPYTTLFELWHRKKSGHVVEIQVNDRMKWGNRLEAVVAAGIAQDQGWTVAPFKDYMRVPQLRLGSSFDFRIVTDTTGLDGILEIKTVDGLAFKNGWRMEDDALVAPAHIEIQLQHQMLVSGLRWGYIGALVGGNDVRLIRREADDDVHAAIDSKARAFWRSIEANNPPRPNMPEDAGVLIALNQHAEPGKEITDEALIDQCARYAELGREIKEREEQREVIKASLMTAIGDAEKARAGNYTITAGVRGETLIPEYTRKSYRDFRITVKQEKSK
jgi:putative phage-type endonuclease